VARRNFALTRRSHKPAVNLAVIRLITTRKITPMRNFPFFRVMAIPVCILWGLLEFVALQRSRWQRRTQT
jgi:hypothetical protein